VTRPRADFASDNAAGVHPAVLAALAVANNGYAYPYGDDGWTERASARIRQALGAPTAEVLFVATGTGANLVGLASALGRETGVICADTAHLTVDESSAPQSFFGAKLYEGRTVHAKIGPEEVERILGSRRALGPEPRVVSLTQATEQGTVYTLDELEQLRSLCSERELKLHIDGARLANAAASLGVPLARLITHAGADVVTVGGTKSGLAFGEALVFLDPEIAGGARFVRKQAGQLVPKLRFVAAQFEALFEDDLWLRGALHANTMAQRLADGVRATPGVEILRPVEANMVIARVPPAAAAALAERYSFFAIDDRADVVRWMTSWATTAEEVDRFVAALATAG
jgi:threonine aldolase